MDLRPAVCIAAFAFFGTAFADDALPKVMEGKWSASNRPISGNAAVEVVKWQGPDKADVVVTLTDVYNKPPTEGAGTCRVSDPGAAERGSDGWKISVRNIRCASFNIFVKQVEGKQRFEGTYSNDAGGAGSIYFEGK